MRDLACEMLEVLEFSLSMKTSSRLCELYAACVATLTRVAQVLSSAMTFSLNVAYMFFPATPHRGS